MPAYYKKVEAVQFVLTDEQKADIAKRKAVFFEGSPVRHVGGDQYLAILQQGENLHRIYTGQWLVRHTDGMWQIIQPEAFNRHFVKSPDDNYTTGYDPFKTKSFNQPTVL